MLRIHERVSRVLPPAIALWPKLDEVDVFQPINKNGFPNSTEKRRYIVNLKFNDEDHRDVDVWLKKCLVDFGLVDGRLPWKMNETGELTLLCHSGENYRPVAVDACNIEVSPHINIGGGSKLKVHVVVNPYTGFGGGISLTIKSYQILDLRQHHQHPLMPALGLPHFVNSH